MKNVILGIVMISVILFIFVPWYECEVQAINNKQFSGLSVLVNARVINSQSIPMQLDTGEIVGYQVISCLPRASGISLTAMYFILSILIGVGAFLTRKQQGPLWFWIVALIASIISLIFLFISSMYIPTSQILIGSYLSALTALVLIILLFIGMIRSLVMKFRNRSLAT